MPMETIRNLVAMMIVLIFATSCHHFGNRMVVNNGKDRLEINYYGDIKFTEDETAIQSISKNGYLDYKKNDRGLRLTHNEKGEMKCVMFMDGHKVNPASPEGKKLITEAIQDMISVGFDAQGRINRLVKKGGLRAVLNEVDHIDGDFVKSIYLEYLILSDSIHRDEVNEIAKKINAQLGSDFEKSKLLQKFTARQMKDSLISQTYFEAVKSIGSDFEKANTLKYRIRQPLTKEQFDEVLIASNTIVSDFEKANLLKELIDLRIYEGGSLNNLLSSDDHIGSDFEKANLLKKLVDQEIFEGESFSNLLNSVDHIGSDFEKTNVLKKLVGKDIKTEEQWVGLINGTAQVSSEFERCNVLIQIANKMPQSEELKTNYLKVAKTINSEYDQERVLKAVD